MNLKKLLLTVFVVLVFTVIFLLCFQHCARAETLNAISTDEVSIENGPSNEPITDTEEPGSEITDKGKEIGIYIKEKILPVVVGVLTSVSALLATLMAIKRALSSIGEAKDTFKKEAKERDTRFEKESEYLNKKTEEIEAALSVVPQLEGEVLRLKESCDTLMTECTYLGKMISLGFSQNKDVVSSGNGKKINRLLKECQRISGNEEGEDEE